MDLKSKPRRRHSAQFKAQVVSACLKPGVSVAAVARQFDLNDNLVHQWRRGRGAGQVEPDAADATSARPMEFVAMALPSLAPVPTPTTVSSSPSNVEPIRIEVRRGAATVNVTWPTAAAGDCAVWLRELLR